MPNCHSQFSLGKMRQHLDKFNQYYSSIHFNDYDSFKNEVLISDEKTFSSRIFGLFSSNQLKSCSFGMTSGTHGNAKLLAASLWRKEDNLQYAAYLKKTLEKYVLSKDDVVANLFTAGGLSTLYDGCNRLLEGIKCSVLPIGRLDSFSCTAQKNMIQAMKQLRVNVLLGTPSSIIYLLELSKSIDINLDIKKIIFTGEAFSPRKRAYVKNYWKNTQFFGLYGHSEAGFIGFNTDQCHPDHYHFFSDWFFIETDNNNVLVTSYADSLMPIIRYRVGDLARLIMHDCPCHIDLPILALQGRSDKKFNYAGNLIDSAIIKNKIYHTFDQDIEFQIQINTDSSGKDNLTLIANEISLDKTVASKQLYNLLWEIDEIGEAIKKQAGDIYIKINNDFIVTERQKRPLIIDQRIGEVNYDTL